MDRACALNGFRGTGEPGVMKLEREIDGFEAYLEGETIEPCNWQMVGKRVSRQGRV